MLREPNTASGSGLGKGTVGSRALGLIQRLASRWTRPQAVREELAFAKSPERLQAALDASGAGTFRWNIRTGAVEWDANLEGLFGLEPGGAPRSLERFIAMVHREDRGGVVERCDRSARDGVDFDMEYRVVMADGSIRWLDDKGRTFSDSTGAPSHVTGICVDVTSRKRAEELLLEQKRLLELVAAGKPLQESLNALIDSVSRLQPSARAALLILDGDRSAIGDSFAVDLAPSFGEAIRGAAIAEVLGGTCGAGLIAGQAVTCDDVERAGQWSSMWRDLCVAHGIKACHAHPVLGADGKAIASFVLCSATVRGPDEWELRIAAFGAHVASIVIERERATRALQDSQARLAEELSDSWLLQRLGAEITHEENAATLYEKITDAALVIMRSEYASLQMLYPERGIGGELLLLAFRGFNPEAAQFWHWVRADSQSTCGAALRTGRRVVASDVRKSELMAGSDDLAAYLQTGIHAVQTTPLLSRSGQTVGMISTHWREPHEPSERDLRLFDILARQAADLIERRRNEESLRRSESALKEADRRKDEFLAILAHELRNPLAPLSNSLEILRLAGSRPEAVEQARAVMERQLSQMVRLVDELLDVNRISRGKVDLHKQRLPITTVIEQAIETSRPLIEAAGHELAVDLPAHPIFVHADPVRMTQVFANLLNNAAKFSQPGGAIRLVGELGQGEVIVRIQDMGIGIAAESLPGIFEMFAQADLSPERTRGGLGIGLALVRGLVQMHGGSVEAKSPGRGQGSEFTVRLPTALALVAESPPEPQADRPSLNRRILVVDDNQDSANSLALMLEMMGHETRSAYSALQALDMGPAFRPDAVVLDLGMPHVSGYEAARRIRGETWGKNVLLIALTGWGQEEDRRRSSEVSFDAHLVKPADREQLERLLQSAIRALA